MDSAMLDRRAFLKLGMAAGATAAVAAAFPKFSMAKVRTVKITDCMDMGPEDMAKQSQMVMDSWAYIQDMVATIEDDEIRATVEGILRQPAPTFMANLMDEPNRREAYTELSAKGLIANVAFEDFLPPTQNPYQSPHPFIAGPGSGYGSHHAYPGGLVTHTALNRDFHSD